MKRTQRHADDRDTKYARVEPSNKQEVLVSFRFYTNDTAISAVELLSHLRKQFREKPKPTWKGKMIVQDVGGNICSYNVFSKTIQDKFKLRVEEAMNVSQLQHSGLVVIDVYKQPTELYSLDSSRIKRLNMEKPCCCTTTELRNGDLTCSWGDSLYTYDRKTDTIKFLVKMALYAKEAGDVICQLSDGRIIIGTTGEWVLFDERYNQLQVFNFEIDSIVELGPGIVLVVDTESKFYTINLETRNKENIDLDITHVLQMIILQNGSLMIGTSANLYILEEFEIMREENVDRLDLEKDFYREVAPNVIGYIDGEHACTFNAVTGESTKYPIDGQFLLFVLE
jgi:hypothetical protein